VLPWEDRAEFEALVADLTARLRPADEIELALLLQYADATWRRQRCAILETGLLAGAMPETPEGCPDGVHPTAWALGQAWLARGKELNRLSLHESRLARLAERALDRLAAAQSRRRQAEAELALESQIEQTPSAAPAGGEGTVAEGGASRKPGGEPRSGEGGPAWSRPPGSARRPDPHSDPLPQERDREQDQALTPELASFLRNAA
jgi:hypothetical protein